jgi:hypothetical protein
MRDVPLHRSLLRRSTLRNFRWLQRALSDRRRSFSGTRCRSNPCFTQKTSFTALPEGVQERKARDSGQTIDAENCVSPVPLPLQGNAVVFYYDPGRRTRTSLPWADIRSHFSGMRRKGYGFHVLPKKWFLTEPQRHGVMRTQSMLVGFRLGDDETCITRTIRVAASAATP